MSRSKTLYQLQKFDTLLDQSTDRIREIDRILGDNKELDQAISQQDQAETVLNEKVRILKSAETAAQSTFFV